MQKPCQIAFLTIYFMKKCNVYMDLSEKRERIKNHQNSRLAFSGRDYNKSQNSPESRAEREIMAKRERKQAAHKALLTSPTMSLGTIAAEADEIAKGFSIAGKDDWYIIRMKFKPYLGINRPQMRLRGYHKVVGWLIKLFNSVVVRRESEGFVQFQAPKFSGEVAKGAALLNLNNGEIYCVYLVRANDVLKKSSSYKITAPAGFTNELFNNISRCLGEDGNRVLERAWKDNKRGGLDWGAEV